MPTFASVGGFVASGAEGALLVEGATYYASIRARNAAGLTSEWTHSEQNEGRDFGVAPVSVLAARAPSAPSSVVVTPLSRTQVAVDFSAPTEHGDAVEAVEVEWWLASDDEMRPEV